ncbi:hypothetical protein C7121_01025 [Paenibacillus glucanolyticus]|uniref:helix-turn-helix domain-containing protein n=1 Tax=Paenibacillus TaxID=44249 RepID=UPI0003E1F7E6|nr:hypothetical protein C7121_01025 [Paenibacillus glucanolyticus]ETT36384.1 transposase orfA for insertion sequence element IS3 family protein [Paenibacillus sp. FSL R5-808]
MEKPPGSTDEILGGVFLWDKSLDIFNCTEKEAIRLHIEEKWTYRRITKHLEVQGADRVKKWMRKYRELGEFGLLDGRGRRKQYMSQDR